MKKRILFAFIFLSLLGFLNASVLEGAAELGPGLPQKGLYFSTNSYPVNTVVDVTNLENGRKEPLLVFSGHDVPGFLALLSKDAAGLLGIEGRSQSRIRMEENTDPLVISKIRADYNFTLVPDRPRPPENNAEPDPAYFIPQVKPGGESLDAPFIDPSLFIEPLRDKAGISSVFSVPLIGSMEKGKHYVQIAAYSNTESVEYEISRIDKNLPMAVMNAGSEDKPVYRVLIGPISAWESGAILERCKLTYGGAFVWQGK
jgi:hypothetical protein